MVLQWVVVILMTRGAAGLEIVFASLNEDMLWIAGGWIIIVVGRTAT